RKLLSLRFGHVSRDRRSAAETGGLMATTTPHPIPPPSTKERPARPSRPLAAEVRRRSRWSQAQRSWRLHWQLYLLVSVPLAYFVIFKYIPMAFNVIAFKEYSPVL